MPNDPTPTPLTEAEIQKIEQLRKHATQTPLIDAELYFCVLDRIPALLSAARENAGLREEVAALRTSVGTTDWLAITAERDGLREERDAARAYASDFDKLSAMYGEVTSERDAALARVAELEAMLKSIKCIDHASGFSYCPLCNYYDYGDDMPKHADGCKYAALTIPPPDPKWVRCPNGCIDGIINAGWGVKMTCCWCVSSDKPGWVKETKQ